jgi:hypothetical protein
MAEDKTNRDSNLPIPQGGANEQRYRRPAIIWEQPFDELVTLAAACGKSNPGEGDACAIAPAS